MSPEAVGITGIVVLLFLFALRMPVAFSMALVGFAGFAYLNGTQSALTILGQDVFDTFTSYNLSVIPMFILMGSFAFSAGISKRLYQACYDWVGQFRGGVTSATVAACAGFGAICGSTVATTAAMGKIALPEMRKYGYNDRLSTGTIASSGILGTLIPPSTVFIVYGILAEESIGKLFVAGIVPGILLAVLFIMTVAFICWRNPDFGPPGPAVSWKMRLKSVVALSEVILLFGVTIGGILCGWFSPTQAGAVGAAGALLIGLLRGLDIRETIESVKDGLRTACMVLCVIMGATVFGQFLAISNVPFVLADWLGGLPLPPIIIMVFVILIFFLGGFFMDSMALVIVAVPIFLPVVMELGFNSIWFGVIIVVVAGMGVITPPVGVSVFVVKGIAPEIELNTIFRGIFPFLGALIVLTILLMIFPGIATFLPDLVY